MPKNITYGVKDGKKIKWEHWSCRGMLHRNNGPALIEYDADGTITRKEWYLNGVRQIKEDFNTLTKVRQFQAYDLFTPIEIAWLIRKKS